MASKTVELTEKNFEETLGKGGILFIDFWAGWCGPCKAFAPVFDAAAEKHADITFAKVNTDQQQALAQAFEIRGIPTLAVFRDGIMLWQNAGALPAAAFESVIEQVRGVDMDSVKAKVAQAQAQAQNQPGASPKA